MNHASILASWILLAIGLTACGGGGDGGGTPSDPPPPNTPPNADFSFLCTDLECSFTNTSTDNDLGSVLTYSWDFGDGAPVTTMDVIHTFPATAPFTHRVTLTVTDNAGATDTISRDVTVTAPSGGAIADFTVACAALTCTFTNTSTLLGAMVTFLWEFGDNETSTTPGFAPSPLEHTYSALTPTTFTILLTVSSDGLTSSTTRTVQLAPPASTLDCAQGGAACTLGLVQDSTVTVTLVSRSCAAVGNQFIITAPIVETLFTDGCNSPPVGTEFPLNGGAVFTANTSLEAEVISGVGSSLVTNPEISVSGDFFDGWTLAFDDGAGGPGEPDFDDLIILIKATPSP